MLSFAPKAKNDTSSFHGTESTRLTPLGHTGSGFDVGVILFLVEDFGSPATCFVAYVVIGTCGMEELKSFHQV